MKKSKPNKPLAKAKCPTPVYWNNPTPAKEVKCPCEGKILNCPHCNGSGICGDRLYNPNPTPRTMYELIADHDCCGYFNGVCNDCITSLEKLLKLWIKEKIEGMKKDTKLKYNKSKYSYNKLVCVKIDGYNQALTDVLKELGVE